MSRATDPGLRAGIGHGRDPAAPPPPMNPYGAATAVMTGRRDANSSRAPFAATRGQRPRGSASGYSRGHPG